MRGFTLIELLVVIAIIGLLAAIVFNSVNEARARAFDASVRTEMKTIQTEAALFHLEHDTYDLGPGIGLCEEDKVVSILRKVYPLYDPNDTALQFDINCNDDLDGWVLSIPLSASTNHWCGDHTGRVLEIPNTVAEGVYECP